MAADGSNKLTMTHCFRLVEHKQSGTVTMVHSAERTHEEDCLVGLVVKASASRAKDPGFESRLRRDFSGVESQVT